MYKLLTYTYTQMAIRGWNKFYIAVDVHGVILKPNYEVKISTEFYPLAKSVLQYLSKRKDVHLMLYTCSHKEQIEEYLELFKKNNIFFDTVNENPEVKETLYGDYTKKPYFNILLDDKAMFEPHKHWGEIIEFYNEENIEIFKEFPLNMLQINNEN